MLECLRGSPTGKENDTDDGPRQPLSPSARRPSTRDAVGGSPASAANAVDLATVSFRRSAGAAIAHGEQGLKLVALGRRWTAIVETLNGDRGTNPLGDHPGDVDDPLALVDARFDVIADPHRRRWFRRGTVDRHMPTTTGGGGVRTGLGDPHGVQPLVDAH